MLRGFVLLIVLAVVATPGATLLCGQRCEFDDQTARSGACDRHSQAMSVIRPEDETCDRPILGPVAWLRDDVHRLTSAPVWHQAVLGPHHRLYSSADNDRPHVTQTAARTPELRPLSALRI